MEFSENYCLCGVQGHVCQLKNTQLNTWCHRKKSIPIHRKPYCMTSVFLSCPLSLLRRCSGPHGPTVGCIFTLFGCDGRFPCRVTVLTVNDRLKTWRWTNWGMDGFGASQIWLASWMFCCDSPPQKTHLTFFCRSVFFLRHVVSLKENAVWFRGGTTHVFLDYYSFR